MSRTHVIAVVSAILLSVFVLEQVRRRRLREEYSWLWLLTAVGYSLATGDWLPESSYTYNLLSGDIHLELE